MAKNVTVIARLRAKAGKENELRQVLLGLVAPTHAEEGCVNYDLHESSDKPGLFFFHENWMSAECLDRHFESPHLKRVQSMATDLLAEPLEIHQLSMISQPKAKNSV